MRASTAQPDDSVRRHPHSPMSREFAMSSHRRPGVLARALHSRRSPSKAALPASYEPDFKLVDGGTHVTHLVSPAELAASLRSKTGACLAVCGARVVVASMVDPGVASVQPASVPGRRGGWWGHRRGSWSPAISHSTGARRIRSRCARSAGVAVAKCGADELACKPDPVHRAPCGSRPAVIHLGLPSPAGSSGLPAGIGRATLDRLRSAPGDRRAFWPCSRWGLPSRPGHPGRWWSLTPPFHPYPGPVDLVGRGGLFSVALIPRVTPGCR